MQEVVVPKETKIFKKVFYNFLQILAKKNLGLVIFIRDGWLTANIYTFWPYQTVFTSQVIQ